MQSDCVLVIPPWAQKRQLEEVKGPQFLQTKQALLFFPFCSQHHWTTLLFLLKDETLYAFHYDPLPNPTTQQSNVFPAAERLIQRVAPKLREAYQFDPAQTKICILRLFCFPFRSHLTKNPSPPSIRSLTPSQRDSKPL
jgi:hypothetical protein